MKASNIIFVIIIFLLLGAGYFIWKKKNQKSAKSDENLVDDGKKYIPQKQSSEDVKALQRSLNNVLQLYKKELLVVDGVIGPKTRAAMEFVSSVKEDTPKTGTIDTGEKRVKVNYDVVFQKINDDTKKVMKYLPGAAWISNLIS